MSNPQRNWHLQQLYEAALRWNWRDQADVKAGRCTEDTEEKAKAVEAAARTLLGIDEPAAQPTTAPEVEELTPGQIRARNYRQWGGDTPEEGGG